MSLRVTDSPVTFATSVSDAVAKSTISGTDLSKIVSSQKVAQPVAVKLEEGAVASPADLKIKRLSVRAAETGENPHMIVKSTNGISLEEALLALGRASVRGGEITDRVYAPDHGLELEFTYDNGTTGYGPVNLIWDIQNQGPIFKEPPATQAFGGGRVIQAGRFEGTPIPPAGPFSGRG